MRISDWSSDVCSSDLLQHALYGHIHLQQQRPLAVLAYQTLYPEKSANAAALSNRIDLVQAGAGIEHGAARRQFDLMTAKGVLNDQFASGIGVGLGKKQRHR